MRKRVLFLLLAYAAFVATALVHAAHSAPAVPFASHSFPYSALVITPTSQTRTQMDTVVQNFYTTWKANYVVGGCATGRRRINYDGGNQTVSEAHGYGMLAAVLMAGYDSDAQAMFDDFYRYFRAHNATGVGGSDLMAWQQDASCANINGPDSASDGDLDIAMALLMADRQWGSCGAIDYRTEGLKVVAAIKLGETDTTHAYIKLGNWAIPSDTTYYPSTRSSDFLLSHYRSFKWASGDTAWDTVLNTTYNIITSLQTNYANTTGLLPDFILNPSSSPAPVVGYFLEDATTDGNYGYNACRDPWRITTDLAASGDLRAQAAMKKLKTYIKSSAGGAAANVNAERYLNGTVIGNYEEMAFSAPYMVNAMSDTADQAWMNAMWTRVSTRPAQDYFGDSIKLISMIVVTGNWWQPEHYGDPCAVGSPTSTPTPTASRTATRSVTPSSSPSATRTVTVPAATATSSATASVTGTMTGTRTRTNTATASATQTAALPTATPTATASGTPTSTLSTTRSATPSSSATATLTAAIPSATSSSSPSVTLSFSASPSPAGTLTDTPSLTPSSSSSASPTLSPVFSATASSTATQTAQDSPSSSATATLTAAIPSATSSSSPSATLSFSASPSPVGTLTDTPSVTLSPTPSFSPSPSNTAAATFTSSITRSSTPSPLPTQTPLNGNCRNVLAYYTSWSKPGYSAADIPYSKLTHICHAFVLPQADGSLDIPAGFIEAGLIPNAHAQGVKVLISVGGASGSANFSAIAASSALRTAFVNNVKAFLLANSYDGVDFDWEFPTSVAEMNNFTALVQATRTGFTAAGHPEWLISGAFSQTTYYAQYYDLTALTPLLNFYNLMTYDYYGPWSSRSGHNAPLFPATGDPSGNSTSGSLNYFINTRGVPANKINFGLAFYGYDFPTASLNGSCPTCATDTNTDRYNMIASLIGNGWTRVWDASASSPYLTRDAGGRVISYDDPQSVQAKSDYALNARGLAGVFMWDLSMDVMGPGQQPLLDAMRNALNCGPTYTPTLTPTPITFSLPGRVQAEDYVAAYDTTVGNSGGIYRADDVDVETTTDAGGGYDVGWSAAGEWLDFKVNASYSGSFDLTFRVATNQTGPLTLSLALDGAPLLASVSLPNTGGWQTWTDVTVPGVSLPAGQHILRIGFVTAGINLNYLDVKVPAGSTATITPTFSASPTLSPTPSVTPIVPSATPSPTAGDGPLVISRCVPGPNPNPTHLYLDMAGPADEVEFKLYDRSMRCVLEGEQGGLNKGWNAVALPLGLRQAGNGTYFYRVLCRRGAVQGKPVVGRLVLLR